VSSYDGIPSLWQLFRARLGKIASRYCCPWAVTSQSDRRGSYWTHLRPSAGRYWRACHLCCGRHDNKIWSYWKTKRWTRATLESISWVRESCLTLDWLCAAMEIASTPHKTHRSWRAAVEMSSYSRCISDSPDLQKYFVVQCDRFILLFPSFSRRCLSFRLGDWGRFRGNPIVCIAEP
jgi:hypothetical protein